MAKEKRENKKKTQLDLLNMGEKMREVKMKIEIEQNAFLDIEQTEKEFTEFIGNFKEECQKEYIIARKLKR